MVDKVSKCAYPHCYHGGKVLESEAVVEKGKRYHWDCLKTKRDIAEIRSNYIENVDKEASTMQLSKVLNDLIFKYNEDIEYICFSINYYGKYKTEIKSPFALLNLRKNNYMKLKYNNYKKQG
jgi:hypothetical protein